MTVTTDYIFSGLNSPYLESAIPNPIGFYGFSKYWERVILNVCKNSIVIRLPILYGYNDKNDKSTVVRDVIEKLSVGKIKIRDFRIKYPTLIDDVVRNMMLLIEKIQRVFIILALKIV